MFPSDDTRLRIDRILDAIPYDQLAPIYCDYGGEAFFDDRRPAIAALGCAWAGALAARLRDMAATPAGASLYVGAGIAEIPALVTEVCDLGRTVLPTNLRREECEVLNRVFADAGLEAVRYQCVDGAAAEATEARIDHLSLVSVLDDPESYPWVSAVTYGRVDPVGLDLEAFAIERDAIRALARRCLDRLEYPAVITTTAEEIPWLLAVGADDLVMDADDELIETAIVGDPIGFLRVAPRGGEGASGAAR